MNTDMTINALRSAYTSGTLTPSVLLAQIRERAADYSDRNIWITLFDEAQINTWINALDPNDIDTKPLWGIPFAIKDNIDLQDIATTAACEDFTYTPHNTATVVSRLMQAGAIPVGKANLDQFATGLNGTRSPWGPCRNSFNSDYISGGSSAGSAVSVALGLSTFSLGTDTAGSGRVPACFNNLVGLKPSRGLVPATGVVPACQSLDCVSIFAYNTDDANRVLAVAEGFDQADPYSRSNPFSNSSRHYGQRQGKIKAGVIPAEQLAFFDDTDYKNAYEQTLETLSQNGFELIEIDYQPFDEAAKLLYEGPWVTERYIATQPLIDDSPQSMNETVRNIIEPGGKPPASELFKAQYRLAAYRQHCDAVLADVDCLLTPTAGRLFTVDEMLAEPILRNSQLGYYTNFVNLLDMAAVAVPTAFTPAGLPFGITILGDTFSDRALLSIANRIQQTFPLTIGALDVKQPALSDTPVANPASTDIVVCGAHLSNMPLNWQLTERGATLKAVTTTSDQYRLYRLPGDNPIRPALVCDQQNGHAIHVEVWSMPTRQLGSFVAAIPSPLGIGKVTLASGSTCSGFICEHGALTGAEEVTGFGGWPSYLASL